MDITKTQLSTATIRIREFLEINGPTEPDLLRLVIDGPIRDTITKKATTVTDANPQPRKLCLDQFLKLSSIAGTGGHAKFMIQNGEVKVNGMLETRRRRQLFEDDIVEVSGQRLPVKRALFAE